MAPTLQYLPLPPITTNTFPAQAHAHVCGTPTLLGLTQGGTRKGAREQAPAPKEWSPPPPHRRRQAPSNTTAQHSSLQQHTRRPHARSAGAQIQMPDPHTPQKVPWPVVSQTKHTDRQRPRRNARLNEERGWEKRGGTSKTKEQSSGHGGARSVVGPDG